jgi:hypothetical protein
MEENGIPESGDSAALSGEARRDRIIEALRRHVVVSFSCLM